MTTSSRELPLHPVIYPEQAFFAQSVGFRPRSTPFPYSMGIHQAPLPPLSQETQEAHPAHFHIHFYPPLLRSSSVRKFLVGFEMLGEAQVSLPASG